MTDLEEAVHDVLAGIAHPGGGDLIGADAVRALAVTEGAVRFVLETAPEHRAAMEALRPAIVAQLQALPGVTQVSVALSAPVAAPPELKADRSPRPVQGVRHVIAVASGKGGVGKSTVSANLALALADRGLKVGLLDADIYGPSQALMMGAEDSRPVGRENRIVPISAQGLKVMSVGFLMDKDKALVWRGPMLVTAMRQLLHDVIWEPLDVMIVDLPPGTGDVQITLSQQVPLTGAVIVTTPQDVALIDARRAIDLFRQTGTPVLGLIENMSSHICSHCGQEDDVFGHGGGQAEAAAQGIAFLGALPLTRKMRETGDSGLPVVRADPEGPEARRFAEVAAALAGVLSTATPAG